MTDTTLTLVVPTDKLADVLAVLADSPASLDPPVRMHHGDGDEPLPAEDLGAAVARNIRTRSVTDEYVMAARIAGYWHERYAGTTEIGPGPMRGKSAALCVACEALEWPMDGNGYPLRPIAD